MRFKSYKSYIQNLLLKNEIICKEEQCDIQRYISPAAGRISKGVQRHYLPERRIKKIYDRYNAIANHT